MIKILDLSNNNGHVNFERARQAGHRRVYLKATEGLGFVDGTFAIRRHAARAVEMKVGAYHFGHPDLPPRAQARLFRQVVGRLRAGDLRPALDFEYGTPSSGWATEFLDEATRLFGVRPLIYSYGDFLHRSHFRRRPASLWLAAYGRNDGAEYPFSVPPPFVVGRVVAHQYTSVARVPGVPGSCDVSHVYLAKAIDVPTFSARRLVKGAIHGR